MTCLATYKALPSLSLLRLSNSTQLHRYSTARALTRGLTTVKPTLQILGLQWVIPCPTRCKPHGAVCRVSTVHGVRQSARVTKHDLLLHLRFQTTQVCQQNVLARHDILNFQHEATKFLIIFLHRTALLEVKQSSLMPELVMHVLELSLNMRTKIPPSAHTKHSPSLITNSAPPGKRLSS